MTKHLWVNLTDLICPELEALPMGSILHFLTNRDLGDRLLPGAYYKPARIDDQFVVIECNDDARPQAIIDALELIGKEKIGRKIRTRITAGPPTSAWAVR